MVESEEKLDSRFRGNDELFDFMGYSTLWDIRPDIALAAPI
jgi:hypothetical protein